MIVFLLLTHPPRSSQFRALFALNEWNYSNFISMTIPNSRGALLIESDFSNAIVWVSNKKVNS